jgi:hypothetical protein
MTIENSIDTELDWRFLELAAIKTQIRNTPEHSTARRSLLRAGLAMLYAHYEGFVKAALSSYYESIEQSRSKINECRYEIRLVSLIAYFRHLKAGNSHVENYDFATLALPAIENNAIRFPRDKEGDIEIKGRSNMWPQKLSENCKDACLSDVFLSDHRTHLKLLVARRNQIAHGKVSFVKSIEEYERFERAVDHVMLSLGIAVIEAVNQEKFLLDGPDFSLLGRWERTRQKRTL